MDPTSNTPQLLLLPHRNEYPRKVRYGLWFVAEVLQRTRSPPSVQSPHIQQRAAREPPPTCPANRPADDRPRTDLSRRTRPPALSPPQLCVIASDIPEVIGSAIGLRLLFGTPMWIGIIVTAIDSMMFLALGAYGVRKIEALMGALVGAMSISWMIELVRVRRHPGAFPAAS